MSRKIITIGEHHVQLPPYPKDKSEILNVNENKDNAYWRRIEFPKLWYDYNEKTKSWQQDTVYDDWGDLISLSYADSEMLKRLLQQENKRRSKGVWMKNYDDIIWLAPGYYYDLQWVQMKDLPRKYGDYREVQNDILTLWHYAKYEWEWCSGLVLPKCKKSGVTQAVAGDFLNEATQQRGAELGVMSKEYDHAVDVPMAYFFHAFDNLPYILQPDVRKRNEHEIIYGAPIPRVGTKSVTRRKKEEVLNTRMFATKTKATGFDGPVMKFVWITELPKTWEASKISPDAIHKKTVETTRLQTKKNGAILYESYMPEIDDRGYREFREICKQSKLDTKSAITGKTQSSLIVHPIYGPDANEECYNKYGKCDRKKALYILNSENDGKKTVSDKLAHRRQYPRDWNDMMDSGGRGTVFDNLRLAIQQREVEAECKSGKRPWREGHLRWTNSLWETGKKENQRPYGEFCSVYFEELTEEQLIKGEEGSIKIFHKLPDEFFNLAILNNHKDEDGEFLAPVPTDNEIVAGNDPTDYAYKSDLAQPSQVAAYGGFLYNPALDTRFNKTISNTPLFEYDFRHENPDDDLEMIIKMILYFNAYWLVEANKKWVVTALKREGLQNFLLLKKSDGAIKPYKKGDEQKLVSTVTGMIDAYVRALKRWFAPFQYMDTFKSPKGIQQIMDFDPAETKIYNLAVALGYWRLAVDSYSVFKLDELDKNGGDDGITEAVNGLINF